MIGLGVDEKVTEARGDPTLKLNRMRGGYLVVRKPILVISKETINHFRCFGRVVPLSKGIPRISIV